MAALAPPAISIPRPMPNADPTRPITIASESTVRMTCARVAPIARSRASSRARCPTSIENVLTMMKEPTKSATPAKTSRKVVKNDNPVWIEVSVSSSTVAPVTASNSPGSAAATAERRVPWETPAAAVTDREVTVPSGANACRAVAGSTSTAVAPNMDPKPTSPVIVTVRARSPMTTRVRSPTCRWARSRVLDSTATSPGPVGPRPTTRVKEGLSGSKASPSEGAPPLLTAMPSLPARMALPCRSGTRGRPLGP